MLIPLDHWRALLSRRHLVAIFIIAACGHVIFGNTPLSQWKQSMTETYSTSPSTATASTFPKDEESSKVTTVDRVSDNTMDPQSTVSTIDVSIKPDNSSGILPLLPWEIRTLMIRRQRKRWNLPPNVHSTCALGSIPQGGRMVNPSLHCPSSEEPYQRLYAAARKISNSCDVCAIVDLMSKYNMTLSLWGDSLQMQVSDALHCALERQGYLVERNIQRFGRLTEKMTKIMTFNVYNHSSHDNHNLTIRYFAQYRPKPYPKAIQKESLALMESPQPYRAHVLFFNFGLHWRYQSRKTYREIMNATLTALLATDMFLVFRETTTQHFDTEWGEYPDEGGEKPFVCRPVNMVNESSQRAWREDIAKEVATELGYQWVQAEESFSWSRRTIMVAPFRDFVARYHDLHPDECTHFCYTPHLWIPLWKSLRLAITKIGELLESNTNKNPLDTTNS